MSMRTLTKMQERKAELERELAEVEEKIEERQEEHARLTPAHALAEELHERLCHHNHTDGCAWFYDSWDKLLGEHSSRARYLKMAQDMLKVTDYETALAIVNCLD